MDLVEIHFKLKSTNGRQIEFGIGKIEPSGSNSTGVANCSFTKILHC
jgi:hypothetical protein